MRAALYTTESFPSAPRTEEKRTIVNPSNTAIHAAVQESAAVGSFTSITQPDVPRLLNATFQAGWQGGDITITGTDANGGYQIEVIADVAGSTVAGTKVFKTVISIEKELVAGTTDTVTIGTSGQANYYSGVFDPVNAASVGLEFATTGTLTGNWTLWRANRHNPSLGDDSHWDKEDAFETSTDFTNPAGAATHWAVEVNGMGSRRWRTKFVSNGAGAGDIQGWVTAEMN